MDGLLEFTRSWVRFYQKGNSVALEYADYLADLANRQTWIPSRKEFLSFAARWPSDLQPQNNELTRSPLSWFSTFVYRGSSHRRKSAACPKFDMVWFYRSPIPVGWKGVIFSIKLFQPAFLTSTVEEGGWGSAPCVCKTSRLSSNSERSDLRL